MHSQAREGSIHSLQLIVQMSNHLQQVTRHVVMVRIGLHIAMAHACRQ